MEYELLYAGHIAYFANCLVAEEGLYYGFGYYSAHVPEVIKLYDSNKKPVMLILTPDEVLKNNEIMNAFGDGDGTGLNFVKRALIQV